MNVLVIGSGGREHALAWKLAQSPSVKKVYCAPGNPNFREIDSVDLTEPEDLAAFASTHDVGLTVVGPEAPLCRGLVDVFRKADLTIFGPTAAAAQLEGSKSYAKDFMLRHDIPTAAYKTCNTLESAEAAVNEFGAPVVIKADGLAAGKGVTVAETREQALKAVRECFRGRFGDAGSLVVIEELLRGEEASILAFCDGKTIVPLASSQDHKAAYDSDTGPNTGGMGAYSPAPVVTDELWRKINAQVLLPFLRGCQEDGLDYRGVIYAGIMISESGTPKVLEFNVRFGDPETQAVLPRLESDLAESMRATAEQRLAEVKLEWAPEPAVCVVLASGGYPGKYEKGQVISGIKDAETTGALVFHAGTALQDGQVVNAGGRVLGVTAKADNLQDAVKKTYAAVEKISWQDMQYRTDIAHRALARTLHKK
ncbi:MAG: phosphoribosylamine--glycine ligase [Lentisphaeria bacterium]